MQHAVCLKSRGFNKPVAVFDPSPDSLSKRASKLLKLTSSSSMTPSVREHCDGCRLYTDED